MAQCLPDFMYKSQGYRLGVEVEAAVKKWGWGGKLSRWGSVSARTSEDFLSSLSYIDIPNMLLFEEAACLLDEICKIPGHSTIFPCFSSL